MIRDQVNFKNPPSHPAKHGQGQSTILTAPTPYMPGLTILTLCTLRHTARLLVLTSTSSFSISSENDETVNANSGHVSWSGPTTSKFRRHLPWRNGTKFGNIAGVRRQTESPFHISFNTCLVLKETGNTIIFLGKSC